MLRRRDFGIGAAAAAVTLSRGRLAAAQAGSKVLRVVPQAVGGGENPRVNGDEAVLKTGQSSHRAALGSVGPGRCETSRRSRWSRMTVRQPSVNAGLRPPPSAADGVDRGLPNSRLHLIEIWPGGAGQARQISCQIFCHRRIYADSRRHRQGEPRTLIRRRIHRVLDKRSRRQAACNPGSHADRYRRA